MKSNNAKKRSAPASIDDLEKMVAIGKPKKGRKADSEDESDFDHLEEES